MKFFILTIFFQVSLACWVYDNCNSCSEKSGLPGLLNNLCYWDVGSNTCKLIIQAPTNDESLVIQPLSCPAPLPAFQYTDDFGRNTAFAFAMASNAEGVNGVKKCPAAKLPNVQVINQYTVNCDIFNSTCSATLFLHPDAGAVVLAFRGSKASAQFLNEAFDLIFSLSEPGDLYSGNVFAYFANAIQLLWDAGLSSDLQTYLQNNPTFQLWTFGHSLGGSLATLAANAAVKNGFVTKDKVVVTTMGEPRTGDYDFASDVTSNVPQAYRIVLENDLVPKMPLKPFLAQTNAYHNNFEVWYDNNMTGPNFVINDIADSWSGSNAELIGNLNIHNSYFNVDMLNYTTIYCH
ncbi:hypothetical protein FO519_010197 [Halicephalobus sp. NKZ332]|nr:hypothetical protein FO519_010197 [Halicephalobus sp. NKZ332]